MSERFVPEEAKDWKPEEFVPQEPVSEPKAANQIPRKIRNVVVGASLGLSALGGELKAQPNVAERATPELAQQPGQQAKEKQHPKKKIKHKPNVAAPKKKINPEYYKGIPKELNAFKDHGIKKEAEYAKEHKLSKIENLAELREFAKKGIIKELPGSGVGYFTRKNFGAKAHPNREHQKYLHYTRPVVIDCIQWLGRNYANRFPKRRVPAQDIMISSLTRDAAVQKRIGGNAASPDKSSHVKADGFDISQANLNKEEKAWLRQTLSALEIAGRIYATEERNGSFHVMVKLEAKFK